jgi:hypothetical protein
MKNLYALDKHERLVHIKDVNRDEKGKYTCCACNGELIARKGKIKAHHFSHKSEGNCSYESYLHKVSKLIFFTEYSRCLVAKEPFHIEIIHKRTCTSCESLEGIQQICKLKNKTKTFELTTYFDIIEIEKGVDGFIADILLSSSSSEEKLLIEFAVTHPCERNKLQSGLKIIEIALTNEKDLKCINYNYISLAYRNIEFHNFNYKHTKGHLHNPKTCERTFDFFTIRPNNNTIKIQQPISQIISTISKENFKHFKVLDNQTDGYSGRHFIDLVVEYASKDTKFKNCFACRFLARNNNEWANSRWFCRGIVKEIENSNEGRNCYKFWRYPTSKRRDIV